MINYTDINFQVLYLNLTDSCNLACKYCFVEQNPHFMTLKIAKQSVKFLLKHKKKGKKARIIFFGGEPTLMWNEVIVPLVDWIKNSYPNDFSFSMTTNATLLSKERIKWLKENNFSLLLSCDGDEETQNINRPCRDSNKNCFQLVSNNFDALLEHYPNITFRSTIDQSTCEKTYDNFMFALNRGFKNHFSVPNSREKWSVENIEKLKLSMNKVFDYYKTNYKTVTMRYAPLEKIIKNFVNGNYKGRTEKKVKRCGLGITAVSVNYKGELFACQEQASYGEDRLFHIGDIENGIDFEKRNKLINTYLEQADIKCENPNLCLGCPINCLDEFCPSSIYDTYGRFDIAPEISCYWKMWLYKAGLDIYLTYKNEDWFIARYKNKSKTFAKTTSQKITSNCSGICENCNSCSPKKIEKKKKFNLFDWWEQKKIELNNKQN